MELIPPSATAKGPGERFTGDVYLNVLHAAQAPSRLMAALVRFTPGARTNWHSHPLGQTLHCTDGLGLVGTRDGTVVVLRPGDTVYTPPGQEHWHGGTRDTMMCHLALVEQDDAGAAATWLEPVSGPDFQAAHTALQPLQQRKTP